MSLSHVHRQYEFEYINRLTLIESHEWDRCLGINGSPFLRYSFLSALEQSHCVGGQSGWLPRYVLVKCQAKVVGVCPAYIKLHSQGEFIFDWSWADAAHRMGLSYYPKLVVTSPFSPISSEKLLCAHIEDENERRHIKKLLIDALRQLAQQENLTGLHLLFTSESELNLCTEHDFLRRHTLQFQWKNDHYQYFEDFLSCFRSKRRNQIKRERRFIREAGVQVKAYMGTDLKEEHIAMMYEFYRSTIEKYYYGNLYLNEAFFKLLYETQKEQICLLLAEYEGEIIGGSFNLISDGVLYGRYWGIKPDIQIDYLHFEVCAYRGIELCIEQGWKRFEAGAGGGGHKHGRGFLPQVIYSAHELYLPGFNEALTELLQHEREYLENDLKSVRGAVLKLKS